MVSCRRERNLAPSPRSYGERVGVRGIHPRYRKRGNSRRLPLTRRYAPTSPRTRGEVKKIGACLIYSADALASPGPDSLSRTPPQDLMTSFPPHQDSALKAVADWLKAKPGKKGTPQVFRLFGYAGTGKTTLARHIADGVDGGVKFAAFTGKAALVMRNKGCDGASTIHSLIYRARESGVEQPSFELWDDAPASKAKLIIIDECSMVDAEMGRDLMSFDCPLLVLGDPAQLPPIQGGGFFTGTEPDAMLTEVHRQAQDDPIVRMSMDIREGRELEIGRYGDSEIVSRAELDPDRVMGADQVLVGRNNTRRSYNMRVRQKQNIEDPLPVAGDKLVCLRNNRKKGLFNGGLWRVKSS